MNTDCAFYIGTTHDVCQDYALAGKNSIAVSDGCSGSPNSDIGSRVLSITAMNKMVELDSLASFDENECILLARPAIKMLNISNECLDATLLSAAIFDNAVHAMCYGDGVIAVKSKNEDIIIINCSYTDNYPFYINYLYDKTGRYRVWQEEHCKKKTTVAAINNGVIIYDERELKYNSRLNDTDKNELGVFKQLDFEYKVMIEIIDKKDIEYIAIMSDGIHSFYETVATDTSKYNKPISYLDVLKDLLTFKNFNKKFVQRRVNMFRKNCAKKNWGNSDDFSLAVIYTGEK